MSVLSSVHSYILTFCERNFWTGQALRLPRTAPACTSAHHAPQHPPPHPPPPPFCPTLPHLLWVLVCAGKQDTWIMNILCTLLHTHSAPPASAHSACPACLHFTCPAHTSLHSGQHSRRLEEVGGGGLSGCNARQQRAAHMRTYRCRTRRRSSWRLIHWDLPFNYN